MRIAAIVPAFNEELSIYNTIVEAKKFVDVIVIDDCSKDKTKEVALSAGAMVFTNSENLGYDKTINAGFQKALELNYDFVITYDADGQHPAENLKDFIEEFKKGSLLVLGARDKFQRFSEKLFSIYTKIFFNIADPLSGYKGYALSIYKHKMEFDTYGSIGTELMFFYIKQGVKKSQFNYKMQDRVAGQPRFAGTIRANYKILRALFFTFLKY